MRIRKPNIKISAAPPGAKRPFAPLQTVHVAGHSSGWYYHLETNPNPDAWTGPYKTEEKALEAGFVELLAGPQGPLQ